MKRLMIALALLPAGLNAMWTPYHNPGTVESMRAIVDKQVADARFHAEMMARQIHAQKQMTLEIAAEQQAAQPAPAQPEPAAEAPYSVEHLEGGPISQVRYYSDRHEVQMRDGTIRTAYNDMSRHGAPVRVVKNPPHDPGAIKAAIIQGIGLNPETETKYYADGTVEHCFDGTKEIRYYADGRSETISRK